MEELNREILLKLAHSLSLDELGDSVSKALAGIALIDIASKRIVFDDGMVPYIGPAALQEMYLETYFQLVPESQRPVISNLYKEMIDAVIAGGNPVLTIKHDVKPAQAREKKSLELDFKEVTIDNHRFLVGLIKEVTDTMGQKVFDQLMSGSIGAYVFTYDVVEDKIYLSKKFRDDFDIPSGVLENFTVNCSKYLYQEDFNLLNEIFGDYLQTGDDITGQIIKFLAPGRGDLYLCLDGISGIGSGGDEEDGRYISGILSDVTLERARQIQAEALDDGSDAIRFIADVNRETLTFLNDISEIFPNARKVITGDFVEEVARSIVVEDRKRFRNAMHRAVNEVGSTFSVEFRIRVNGPVIWLALRGKSYYDEILNSNALTGVIVNLSRLNMVKDIVEKKEASNEITGLPGRDALMNDTANMIRNPKLLSGALLLVDINDFHVFNDNYGREAGNAIVQSVAGFLAEIMPADAKLYHIGVDTFAILLNEVSRKSVSAFLEELVLHSNTSMVTAAGDFFVIYNLAASMYPEGDTAEEIFSNAEIALHKIKNDKSLKYAIYSPADKLELNNRMDFVAQISSCIMNNMENFQMYYQPLIDANTGNLVGAEALLRWQSNQGVLVNPELVVAAIESTDRMAEVGRWIANEAVKQCAKWISKGAPRDFYIHINATADDLIRSDYAAEINELLRKYNLSPDNILIELTETSLMENMAKCRKNLLELAASGIRTALDDFGSGYSSFNYLKELPVDEIKIDKTFTDDMETVEFNASFIRAMTMLAHSINKGVVIEGVETEAQAAKLRDIGVDIFQGYLFGKPMSVFAFWNKFFA